jgi:hypothetical protein
MATISRAKGVGSRPNVDSAAKWFRKALGIDPNATWRDWLKLYARLWRYKYFKIAA